MGSKKKLKYGVADGRQYGLCVLQQKFSFISHHSPSLDCFSNNKTSTPIVLKISSLQFATDFFFFLTATMWEIGL